jgi:glycosyltransferase involved in cell wall biosynthesis
MGGEALKALSVFEGYRALGFDVIQVTHARVRDELLAAGFDNVVYVEDGPVQVVLFRLRQFWLLGVVGSWLLTRAVQREVTSRKPWIVHFTAPITPTGPYFPIRGTHTVIGPLNGSLLHPPALLFRESRAKLIGARVTRAYQWASRYLFRGKRDALLFVSGGARTIRTLEQGGCHARQMVATLDSGVHPILRDRPRLAHRGTNWRFVFLGRLVRYKGCDLVIRALALVPNATLDIIGDGDQLQALLELAEREGVRDRVRFQGYTTDREALFDQLTTYRGFLFPTLAEANGIVIQEAMMLGLPLVCVNWGGPQHLLDPSCATLIEPESEASIIAQLATSMSRLACSPDLADQFSRNARSKAEDQGFDWPNVLESWVGHYDRWLAERGFAHRFSDALPKVAKPRQSEELSHSRQVSSGALTR